MKYPLEGVPVPTKEQVEEAQKILHTESKGEDQGRKTEGADK